MPVEESGTSQIVALAGEIEFGVGDVLQGEAGVGILSGLETPSEKPGGNQQHQADGDLYRDERTS